MDLPRDWAEDDDLVEAIEWREILALVEPMIKRIEAGAALRIAWSLHTLKRMQMIGGSR